MRIHKLLPAAPVLALGLALAGPVTAEVSEYELDNGLRLFVKEDHRAPVVVAQIWYKVGSSYESRGSTGVSHVLEHMMFKGTSNHPAGEFSRLVAAEGGRENAFTGRDYTAYFQQLHVSKLPISFELEADRMQNLRLDPGEFTKELAVVQEERRTRTDDKPTALTYERFLATAYLSSPYRNPVIGWPADLAAMELADLQHWYERWYAPGNAILVVAGDVDPDAVHRLAQRTYGKVPARQTARPKPAVEVAQDGERRLVVRAPAKVPYLVMGYQVPALLTAADRDEAYALEVLSSILDGGSSARLERALVRGSQVANSVSASYGLFDRQTSLFTFSATPGQGRSPAEVEAAIEAEIQRLQAELVSTEELDRVKAQVIASRVYEKDSIFYQAMEIGLLEAVGLGWRTADEYVERVQAVTAEAVREAARKYLQPQRRTLAVLDPQPIEAAPATSPAAHRH